MKTQKVKNTSVLLLLLLLDLCRDDIQTVRRLLRETFEELVKVREKLSLVEKVSGIQEEAVDYGAGTSVRLRATGPQNLAAKQGTRHASSSLSGSLTLGGGLLWEDEVDSTDTTAKDASLLEISKLGVKLGTDMILRFSGMVRGGLDSVLAEVQVDPGEDQFALQKITYHCNPLPWIKAIFSPFGASAQDVAYTLNPLAGQGLTSLVRQGSLLHHTILGRTLGATVGLQRAWLSAAWFSPQGLPPLSMPNETDHAFLQAIVAPTKHLSLGLAMIEPLQMPSTVNQALNEEIVEESVPMQAAEKVRRFAALVALRSFGLVMHGWATSEGDLAMHRSWNGKQWGFSVGPKAVQGAGGEGASWAVAVGRLGETRGIQHWQKAIQPDTYEVSAQIHVGEGMSVIPGITTLRRNDRTTVFAGLKTSWQF